LQIKIDKRCWDRESSEIRFEHQLIERRLNQNAKWLSKKSLIQNIRNAISETRYKKPSHHAVKVHLEFILSCDKYDKNEKGLLRLSKFGNKNSEPNKDPEAELFPYIGNKASNYSGDNYLNAEVQHDEIDLEQDGDIFENLNQKLDQNFDNGISENGVDEDVFGDSDIEGYETDNQQVNNEPEIDYAENHLEHNDYLNRIKFELKKKKHFTISESFNEIFVLYKDTKIKIVYDPSRQDLLLTSRYEISTSIVRESLKLFGKSEMIGQLGIDTIRNLDYLVLKYRSSMIRRSFSEIMPMVEKLIGEAIQLQELTIPS
jgi:hypothetical protein